VNRSATVAMPWTSRSSALWTGRLLSGLLIVFLLMDAGMKLPPLQPVSDTMSALGWPADATTARGLGLLVLAITALYAWPRTAILGALLLTAYLGGAVATHMRVGSPLFSHVLFGVYLGVVAWAGLWLRDPRLRTLLPFAAEH
jgi:hypothetical protein